MKWFRQAESAEQTRLKYARREPGHGTEPKDVLEVWGDLFDCTHLERTEIAELGTRTIAYMEQSLTTFLDLHPGSQITIARCTDPEDQLYLWVTWGNMRGEIGARPFGRCLSLFGFLILSIPLGKELNQLSRLAQLEPSQRHDILIFQSLLKHVLERTIEALDDNTIS